MISGMRKPSPISISSPREMIASPPAASSFRIRNSAAALLLTMIAGLPRTAVEQFARVDVAFAAASGGEIVFEIAVAGGDFEMRERRAAEIGVQNDAGRIHDAMQRRCEPLSEAAFQEFDQAARRGRTLSRMERRASSITARASSTSRR